MNFLDYAFWINQITWHDKMTTPQTYRLNPALSQLSGDIRNEFASRCEWYEWENNYPQVGEEYGLYVNEKLQALTNWMGQEMIKIHTIGRKIWRSVHNESITASKVTAIDDNGAIWEGMWDRDADLVVMRRVK